jgi:hypothetical protein
LALIRYHGWWPSSSDPFWLENQEDSQARIYYYNDYYPGMYAPHLFVDGLDAFWTPSAFEGYILDELDEPSPVVMTLEVAPDFEAGELTVRCEGQPEQGVPGQLRLRFALTESGLFTSSGDGPYNQVMRDVFPSPDGIPLELVHGDPFDVEATAPLSQSWIAWNMEVVAFVQNDEQAYVLQAAKKSIPIFIDLSGSLDGDALVLTWSPLPGVSAFWVHGEPNQSYFSPANENRVAVLAPETMTWSTSNGIGDPDNNWTYVVVAVDDTDQTVVVSNYFGEHDFEAEIP